jgi:hypothetical protein
MFIFVVLQVLLLHPLTIRIDVAVVPSLLIVAFMLVSLSFMNSFSFLVNDGDFIIMLFEAFGDVGDDEAGAASHADFGDMSGRKGNCGSGVLDG